MTEITTNPKMTDLLDYALINKSITYEEINDRLPEELLKDESLGQVISILESNGITIDDNPLILSTKNDNISIRGAVTEGAHSDDEDIVASMIPHSSQRRLVFNERDTSIDDPIRLYLREIGKENLLTGRGRSYNYQSRWKMGKIS